MKWGSFVDKLKRYTLITTLCLSLASVGSVRALEANLPNTLPSQEVPRQTTTTVDPGFAPMLAKQLEDVLNRIVSKQRRVGVVIRVDIGDQSWRGVAGKSRLSVYDCGEVCSKRRVFTDKLVCQNAA
jgi:hypothetical protein